MRIPEGFGEQHEDQRTKTVRTITDGDEFTSTPHKAVLFKGADTVLEGLHIRLIIPRLYVERDDRLSIIDSELFSDA